MDDGKLFWPNRQPYGGKIGIIHIQLDHMTYIEPSAVWPISAAQ